ncbi:MAG: acrylyl-CoA reductase (NADPH), partial [Paracoccaceae bacterium]
MSFNALVVEKDEDGKTHAAVTQLTVDQLPAGDVIV